MDTTGIIIAIIALFVVLVGGGVALVRGRGGASAPPLEQPRTDEATGPPIPDGDPTAVADPDAPSAPGAGSPPGVAAATGPGADVADLAPDPAAVELDRPEAAAGRMARLRERLARSGALGRTLLGLLSRDSLSAADWEEIEETLLMADIGPGPTDELIDKLRTALTVEGSVDTQRAREVLRQELISLVDPDLDRRVAATPVLGPDGEPHPATILVVGVNGTGKTTTVGKLARLLVAEDKQVVLGAADTFRAAAADQLSTWGARVGVDVVRSEREAADPAAVAFDAVSAGREAGADVVLVDTAGRLQNKAGLMDELGKIKRVMSRQAPVSEVLLVLDATTGQNGMRQAQVFADIVDVTGIVLTKLDGTAKGGIVVAVQRELGVPVKLVGIGEGADDLAPFDPTTFVDAIIS